MSSHIYEKPNLPMNVRYNKGARLDAGERLEKLVDIYESVNTLTEHCGNLSTHGGGARTPKHLPVVQRNLFGAAAVILGLLCLLLVIGITVLYTSISLERDELKINYSNLRNDYTELQTQVDISGELCPKGWKRFKCSCYYKSTEMKSWNDSRADCKKREADLVAINNKKEHDFLSELNKDGPSWIGLQAVPTESWEREWVWQWVDKSTTSYMGWAKEQSVIPKNRSTVYIDRQGKWSTGQGSKHWLCEKEV